MEGINKKNEQDKIFPNIGCFHQMLPIWISQIIPWFSDFFVDDTDYTFFFTVTMNPHILNGEVPILPKKRCQQKSPNFRKRYPSLSHSFPPFWLAKTRGFSSSRSGVPGVLVLVTTTGRQLRGLDPRLAGISNGLAGVVTPWAAGWYTSHEEKICQNREKMKQKNRIVNLKQQKEGVGVVL